MSNTSQPSSPSPSASASVQAPASSSSTTVRGPASKAERTADARKAFVSSLRVAARDLDSDLQWRATTIHENAQAVQKQEKDLQKSTKSLAKDNAEAEKWLEKSRKKMAEFEDLDGLEMGLEDDLADVEAMLDLMEEKQRKGEYDPKPK